MCSVYAALFAEVVKYLTIDRQIWNLSLILIIQREIPSIRETDHNEQTWNNV